MADDSRRHTSNGGGHKRTVQPLHGKSDREAAAEVIRHKLDQIYAEEPEAKGEIAEEEQLTHRSKHQKFMHELANSGKDLAQVQTEWHNYYVSLPESEKHQVWQEFYDSNKLISKYHKVSGQVLPQPVVPAESKEVVVQDHTPTMLAVHPAGAGQERRTPRTIKQHIVHTVSAGGTIKAKHHVQSLLFGVSMGAVTLVILLFGFFNEIVIAPFIQPSRSASAAPLILDNNGVAPTSSPEVIIPKINVEIPVDYSQTTTDENQIENALEGGVVHYPTTSVPGQNGNAAFFGHSSNNIFNKGKYKFAFVLLHTLVPGDTFYLTYNSKVYVYKVITKTVVDPSDVEVLNPVAGQTATATLITCDPPGTSLHRLVIVGQQISPAVGTNAASSSNTAAVASENTSSLPGNGPTLFSRLWHSVF
ncbi:MAG TPA: sortase [Candidatus Microsaccharimonas sp.]|nr:sortase [Candidatus Microsaccharimonas sp.]